MRINIKKKDAVWSYLGTILSMCASFLILPFILVYLSDEEVAIYYIFTSISAIATLFDFGFSPSIARSMAYAWSGAKGINQYGVDESNNEEPNYLLIAQIVKACKVIYALLSGIALLMMITIGTKYILYITQDNMCDEYIFSWFIYAFAIFINILYNYYSVFLRGVGAIAKINVATIISRISQIILSVIFLMCGLGLVGVSIAYFMYGLLFRVLGRNWFYQHEKMGEKLRRVNPHISIKDVTNLIKTMWPNTWRDGVVTLSEYLLNQASTIVASIYLPLNQAGVFSLCVQLTTAVSMIAGTMYTVYQPAFQSAYVQRDTKSQRVYMSVVLCAYIGIYFLGMIALVTFGLPLVEYIKPSYKIDVHLLLCIGLYQFILKLRNCYTSYISTTNRIIYWKAFLVSAVVCFALEVVFNSIIVLGVYGLVIAQLISQVIYNAWYWPLLVHKELGMKAKDILTVGLPNLKKLVVMRGA